MQSSCLLLQRRMACRQVKDRFRHSSVLHSERRSNRARRTLTLPHQARHASGTEEEHIEQNTRWPARHRQVQSISQVLCVVVGTIPTDSVHGRELCNLREREKSPTWTTEAEQFSRLPVAESWDGFVRLGQQHLLVVDYFSRIIELAYLQSSTSSETVTAHGKSIFARHGIPEVVQSNNGP